MRESAANEKEDDDDVVEGGDVNRNSWHGERRFFVKLSLLST